MPIDSTLRHKFVPPYSLEPPRRRLLIATLTPIVALLGLALPSSWLDERSGGATSAAVRPAAHQASPPNAHASTSFERGHGSRFFGFLEFDWDPDAPGGVPGFDPWPRP
jgi:hypothetical protein